MSAPDSGGLHGMRVLVTRPTHQAAPLLKALGAAGAIPLAFPTLAIRPLAIPAEISLAAFDLVIFVSTNAVEHCRGPLQAGVGNATVAAVGRATEARLKLAGIERVLAPFAPYNSEALLALLEFSNLQDTRVLIVRGRGGREVLAEGLRAAGASVEYLEVYERISSGVDPRPVVSQLASGQLDAIVVTSVEIRRNLESLLAAAPAKQLHAVPLVVVGERQEDEALQAGWQSITVAATPDEEALLEALARR